MSNTGWDLDGGTDKLEFAKFPIGVTRIRVLSQAPHGRWTHWMGQFNRSVTCPGRGCPIDEMRKQQKDADLPYTYNVAQAFAMNIFNHETNRYEIMEQSKTFMQDLKDVMQDLKDDGKALQDVILKVRRRGEKTETTWRIDVDVEEPFSAAEKSAFENMTNLTEYYKPHTIMQINELLNVPMGSKDEMREAWNNIMNPKGDEATEKDEEIEVEG